MVYVRAWIKTVLEGLLALGGLVMVWNFWVAARTQTAIYNDIRQVCPSKYGLVLGTSPKHRDGTASGFFDKRVAAAALLYQHGKIKHLVLSGTHDRQYYNEPLAMKKALVKLGIPAAAITLDIEGDSTLASIKRIKKTLGVQEMVIVTQRFHGYRALYVSYHCGIKALVFAAGDDRHASLTRALFRETLARVKALIDLHVLQKHCID